MAKDKAEAREATPCFCAVTVGVYVYVWHTSLTESVALRRRRKRKRRTKRPRPRTKRPRRRRPRCVLSRPRTPGQPAAQTCVVYHHGPGVPPWSPRVIDLCHRRIPPRCCVQAQPDAGEEPEGEGQPRSCQLSVHAALTVHWRSVDWSDALAYRQICLPPYSFASTAHGRARRSQNLR